MQLFPHLVGAERQEVDLDIRRRKPGIGFEKRTRCARGDRQRTLAKHCIARAGQNPANRMIEDVIDRGFRAPHHHPDLHVILQIMPYARRIEHNLDAVLLQQRRRSHTGELQQLRRIIRAA
jgi:hypothetical protein